MKPSHKLALKGVLIGGLLALPVAAQPGQPQSQHPQAAQPSKGVSGDVQALKDAKQTNKAERKEEQRAAKGATQAQGEQPERAGGARPERPEVVGKAEERGGRFRGAMRDLLDELREGKLKKEEFKTRLMDLAKDRSERRQKHREAIRERWGQKLSNPTAIAEVRQHERRMAHLNRIAVLAQAEKTGAAQEKILERVEKLIGLENERHEKAMERLQPVAAGAVAPSAEKGAVEEAEESDEVEDKEKDEESPYGGAR